MIPEHYARDIVERPDAIAGSGSSAPQESSMLEITTAMLAPEER